MTSSKDHLVQLVGALVPRLVPNEDKVKQAIALLAEIEKVCPEEPAAVKRLMTAAPEGES